LVNATRAVGEAVIGSGDVDGLHLSQRAVAEWGGVARARCAVGLDRWLGVSAHCPRELRDAEGAADYATISPVFETPCKPGARPLDLERVRAWCSGTTLPTLWLGGIDTERVSRVWQSGVAGIAGIMFGIVITGIVTLAVVVTVAVVVVVFIPVAGTLIIARPEVAADTRCRESKEEGGKER